jgi:hypothetical protein
MSVSILSLEPEHRKNRFGHHRGVKTWEITWVLLDAQAACAFSCSASKMSRYPPMRASMQQMVNTFGDMFTNAVARNRGVGTTQ